jgi:ATP-dependent protease ClpP protease subunit
MSAEEAKAYGLIDNIVAQRGDVIESSKQPTVTA